MSRVLLPSCLVITCLFFSGCQTLPKGFLKPSEDAVKKRQLEMRQYDTTDETKILSSVAGVLQDLGFTLDSSETQLGLVAASKEADAKDAGQIAGAALLDTMGILFGGYSNASGRVDKEQRVKACIIVKLSLDGKQTVIRATFQRIVWNMSNQINRVETITDVNVYKRFYDGLSKSVFLEAQQI